MGSFLGPLGVVYTVERGLRDGSKTQVYLERVRALEERARVALGAAAGLAGVFFAAASLLW